MGWRFSHPVPSPVANLKMFQRVCSRRPHESFPDMPHLQHSMGGNRANRLWCSNLTLMTDSARQTLEDLRTRYQGAPILSLAQTSLWDDPMKALVKGLLDANLPDTRLVLGVMDTDYLSRLRKRTQGDAAYDILPHNDGSTRDMWAAVGEMSSLLGAETPLPVSVLATEGVRRCQAMAALGSPACKEFIDGVTEAWGWRGLVQTNGRRRLAGDVPVRDLVGPLLRQLDWAFEETARVAARPLAPFAGRLRAAVAAYADAHPTDSLSALYLAVLPLIYGTLLGYAPRGIEYALSSELLRFDATTAMRARFRPLDVFLDPRSRVVARRHYDEAVRPSGIASLDRFGPEAIPFDLAISGRGRGTIHLSDTMIRVDTDDPIEIPLSSPIQDRRGLAMTLGAALGPGVALLGKAVVLITMLAGEYIFLFNETGSAYVPSSADWNRRLRSEGMGLRLYPILRLGVQPWDAVGQVGGHFALPPHMARTFGRETIPTSEFGNAWRLAAASGRARLETIREITRPLDWLDHLAAVAGGEWTALAAEYRNLLEERSEHGTRVTEINARGMAILEAIRVARREADELQKEKGWHWRSCVQPLRDAARSAGHDGEQGDSPETHLAQQMDRRFSLEALIQAKRQEVSRLLDDRNELNARRTALTQDPDVEARDARLRAIETRGEREKAGRVRDAWMTAEALSHTEPRPTAWWFPSVDPTGGWFDEVSRTAEFRWEDLGGS